VSTTHGIYCYIKDELIWKHELNDKIPFPNYYHVGFSNKHIVLYNYSTSKGSSSSEYSTIIIDKHNGTPIESFSQDSIYYEQCAILEEQLLFYADEFQKPNARLIDLNSFQVENLNILGHRVILTTGEKSFIAISSSQINSEHSNQIKHVFVDNLTSKSYSTRFKNEVFLYTPLVGGEMSILSLEDRRLIEFSLNDDVVHISSDGTVLLRNKSDQNRYRISDLHKELSLQQ
jgi:hypothetical protein